MQQNCGEPCACTQRPHTKGSRSLNAPQLLGLSLFYCKNESSKFSFYKPCTVLSEAMISLLLCHQLQRRVCDPVGFCWLYTSASAFPKRIAPAVSLLTAPCAQVWASFTRRSSSLLFLAPQLEAFSSSQLHPEGWASKSCPGAVGHTMENPWKFTHSPSSAQVLQFSDFFKIIFYVSQKNNGGP